MRFLVFLQFLPFFCLTFSLFCGWKRRWITAQRNQRIMTRRRPQSLIGHGGHWLMRRKNGPWVCNNCIFPVSSPFVTALCGIFNKLKWHQMQQGSDILSWIGKPYVRISHAFPFPTGRALPLCGSSLVACRFYNRSRRPRNQPEPLSPARPLSTLIHLFSLLPRIASSLSYHPCSWDWDLVIKG